MTVVLGLIVGEKSHRYRTRKKEGRSADLGKTFHSMDRQSTRTKFMITVFTAESYTIYLVLPSVCYTYTQLLVAGRLLAFTSDILPLDIIHIPYSSPEEYDQIT